MSRVDFDETGKVVRVYGTVLCNDCRAEDEVEDLRNFRVKDFFVPLCKSCAHKRWMPWFIGERRGPSPGTVVR